jgi:hypothetical protein
MLTSTATTFYPLFFLYLKSNQKLNSNATYLNVIYSKAKHKDINRENTNTNATTKRKCIMKHKKIMIETNFFH